MSTFVIMFIQILYWALAGAILGRVLMSWIDPMGNMRISQVLRDLSEPILAPIRSVIPTIGMFDLSPLIALILLDLVRRLIVGALI